MNTRVLFVTFLVSVIVGLVLSIAGCTSMDVHFDVDKDADFASYETYDWIPFPETSREHNGTQSQVVEHVEFIRSTVAAQLTGKGLRRVTENPDLLVTEHGGSESRIDVTGSGYDYGGNYSGWQGSGIGVYSYKGGTLVVDLVDARTGRLVWRGSAEGTFVAGTPGQTKKLIVKAIETMFEAYPPPPGK